MKATEILKQRDKAYAKLEATSKQLEFRSPRNGQLIASVKSEYDYALKTTVFLVYIKDDETALHPSTVLAMAAWLTDLGLGGDA